MKELIFAMHNVKRNTSLITPLHYFEARKVTLGLTTANQTAREKGSVSELGLWRPVNTARGLCVRL
jgi:hypothetical protein